jgi:cytochrome c biogenesis protein CcdA/thiol-disulfide isomerase/thioredoxin
MLVLIGIGLLAGAITSISPCVLPVLPALVAGGAGGGGPRRPYAIIAGLVASFTFFTLAGAWLLDRLGLPEDVLRNIAIALLLVLAATLIVPRLGLLLERPLLPLTRRRLGGESNGLLLGVGLGLVYVPCAGPVLAAVTAIAATGQVGLSTFVVTSAYAVGAAVPMLLFALGGRRLATGLTALRTHAPLVRRAAGVVLAATALAIALGVDQRFTTALPGYTQTLQDRVERSSVARRELQKLRGGGQAAAADAAHRPRAPDFRGISLWLNTPGGRPLSIAQLRGRVLLVDFWTYSCINCLRTLPHLRAWDAAYRRHGLVIVGVHTPEFAFERRPSNVRSAVRRLGVHYPVALDPDYKTWNAYANEFWPEEYLIDRRGRIRDVHLGEGEYAETERTIRNLLGEPAVAPTHVADRTPTEPTTPESYLGYARLDRFRGPIAPDREATYRFGPVLGRHELAYAGSWRVEPRRIVAGSHARLRLRFRARDVYVVLGGRGRVAATIDGVPVRTIRVRGAPRLYTVATGPALREGLLELRFARGVEGYAFTFG